jgi:hypothetical protein
MLKMKYSQILIKTKNTTQKSIIFVDSVELKKNHIMRYSKKELIFKVWLKKKYRSLKKAADDVGIELRRY